MDPHRIGGQDQAKGNAAGFDKYWSDNNDIRRMIIIAQNSVPGPGDVFLVVAGSSVYLETPSIFIAKKYLRRYSGSTPSRMVVEVQNGIARKDPHNVGGQDQGKGSVTRFNQYCADGNDIRCMTAISQAYADDTEINYLTSIKCSDDNNLYSFDLFLLIIQKYANTQVSGSWDVDYMKASTMDSSDYIKYGLMSLRILINIPRVSNISFPFCVRC